MKRIINGKTYNTETSTLLHHADVPPGWEDIVVDRLYQTRHGAYFLWNADRRKLPEEFGYEELEPLTDEQAQRWMEKNRLADMIEAHFGEMPEAGEAEGRFTLRMPESLKNRLDALAGAKRQSLNAWIVRCLEGCASKQEAEEVQA